MSLVKDWLPTLSHSTFHVQSLSSPILCLYLSTYLFSPPNRKQCQIQNHIFLKAQNTMVNRHQYFIHICISRQNFAKYAELFEKKKNCSGLCEIFWVLTPSAPSLRSHHLLAEPSSHWNLDSIIFFSSEMKIFISHISLIIKDNWTFTSQNFDHLCLVLLWGQMILTEEESIFLLTYFLWYSSPQYHLLLASVL